MTASANDPAFLSDLYALQGEAPFIGNSAKRLSFMTTSRVAAHLRAGRGASALSCIHALIYFLQEEKKENAERAQWELQRKTGGEAC